MATILLRIAGVAFVANAYSPMHYHVAAAVEAAGIEGARIDALFIETGLVVGALGVLCALWDWFCEYIKFSNLRCHAVRIRISILFDVLLR